MHTTLRHRFTAPLLTAALALALLLPFAGARADQFYWNDTGTANWDDMDNWRQVYLDNNTGAETSVNPSLRLPTLADNDVAIITGGTAILSTGSASVGSIAMNFDYNSLAAGLVLDGDATLLYDSITHDTGTASILITGSATLIGDNHGYGSHLNIGTNTAGSLEISDHGRLNITKGLVNLAFDGSGTASLLLKDDGQMEGGDFNIATGGNGVFTGTITDNAVWTVGSAILGGFGGNATLEVTGDARVNMGLLMAGEGPGGVAHITIRDNARWEGGGTYFGRWGGPGNLTLKDTATFVSRWDVELAEDGAANITIGGQARFIAERNFMAGNGYAYNNSAAVLTFEESGRLEVGGRFSTGFAIGEPDEDEYADTRLFTLNVTFSADRPDGLAYIAADEVVLHGTTTLGLLGFTGMTPGDTLTLLLIDSDALAGAFDSVLVDGAAVLNWVETSAGVYEFDDANNFHYTLDYTADGGNDMQLTVTAAAVPEPGTWAMLVGGLGTMALLRRRKA